MTTNQIPLFRTPIAGLKFHQAWNIDKPIYQNRIARLIPEPNNKFDSRAIRAVIDEVILGYIPRSLTEKVHENWTRNPTAFVVLHQPKVIVIDVMVDEEVSNEKV